LGTRLVEKTNLLGRLPGEQMIPGPSGRVWTTRPSIRLFSIVGFSFIDPVWVDKNKKAYVQTFSALLSQGRETF
jgi:hypothetical protein